MKRILQKSIVSFLTCMFFNGCLRSMAFSVARRNRGMERCRIVVSSLESGGATVSSLGMEAASTITTTTTRYTIDTPPINRELLQSTVCRNFDNFDQYLTSRPLAGHTNEAFEQFLAELDKTPSTLAGLILDSGCGTGRSSLVLGEEYPSHLVVGVDRSIDRLGRTARDLGAPASSSADNDKNNKSSTDRQHVQRVRDNVVLVRAELVHFWRLWWQHGLVAEQHYLLYPNPYPKKSRLKQRWYAHPSFPLLLVVSAGNPLKLRSNWKQYLQEFADAVEYASQYESSGLDISSNSSKASQVANTYLATAKLGPILRDPVAGEAWTNFEAKYDKIGEATYELRLEGKR